MRTFLINLDSERARLVAITAQLKSHGVVYERISAINGKNLSQKERNSSVNHFRWWCAVGRPVRIGEIGCAMSHYAIYKKMQQDDLKVACVLEDDVILNERFNSVLEFAERNIDANKPQVFLLSNHTGVIDENEDCHIVACKNDMYTEGYVITAHAAKALLKVNFPLQTPCDWWGRWARRRIIELYHVFPTVCSQDQGQYESGTCGKDDFDVSRLSLPMYLLHKAKRLVGKSIDAILR